MATPKKKHLIELMIEAGVKWPEGAEYAAQDNRDLYVWFYSEKPKLAGVNKGNWTSDVNYENGRKCRIVDGEKLNEICLDWHQTIVTREQYAEAVSAIGGKTNQVCESHDIPPSQPSPQYCASVMRQMPDSTIEQLTADYHAKAAEADRLQSVADEALKAADDALLALEKASKLLGLIVSIDTKTKHVEQQCSSAEWKIGDKCIVTDSPDDADFVGRECVIIEIDAVDNELPYRVSNQWDWELWVASIRRP